MQVQGFKVQTAKDSSGIKHSSASKRVVLITGGPSAGARNLAQQLVARGWALVEQEGSPSSTTSYGAKQLREAIVKSTQDVVVVEYGVHHSFTNVTFKRAFMSRFQNAVAEVRVQPIPVVGAVHLVTDMEACMLFCDAIPNSLYSPSRSITEPARKAYVKAVHSNMAPMLGDGFAQIITANALTDIQSVLEYLGNSRGFQDAASRAQQPGNAQPQPPAVGGAGMRNAAAASSAPTAAAAAGGMRSSATAIARPPAARTAAAAAGMRSAAAAETSWEPAAGAHRRTQAVSAPLPPPTAGFGARQGAGGGAQAQGFGSQATAAAQGSQRPMAGTAPRAVAAEGISPASAHRGAFPAGVPASGPLMAPDWGVGSQEPARRHFGGNLPTPSGASNQLSRGPAGDWGQQGAALGPGAAEASGFRDRGERINQEYGANVTQLGQSIRDTFLTDNLMDVRNPPALAAPRLAPGENMNQAEIEAITEAMRGRGREAELADEVPHALALDISDAVRAVESSPEERFQMLDLMSIHENHRKEIPRVLLQLGQTEMSESDIKHYSQLAQVLCERKSGQKELFEEVFREHLAAIHSLSEKERTYVAQVLAFLLANSVLSWKIVRLLRVGVDSGEAMHHFVEVLFKELLRILKEKELVRRLEDSVHPEWFEGIFPKESEHDVNHADSFFYNIGLECITGTLQDTMDSFNAQREAERVSADVPVDDNNDDDMQE